MILVLHYGHDKPSNGMQLHIDSLKPIVYVTTHDRKRTFLTEHKMISNSEDSFKNLFTRARYLWQD